MTRRITRTAPPRRSKGAALIVAAASAFVNLFAIGAEPTAVLTQGETPLWKAGVAKVVVTPETAVWLAGYGTKRAPDGKLHDLWVKAWRSRTRTAVAWC